MIKETFLSNIVLQNYLGGVSYKIQKCSSPFKYKCKNTNEIFIWAVIFGKKNSILRAHVHFIFSPFPNPFWLEKKNSPRHPRTHKGLSAPQTIFEQITRQWPKKKRNSSTESVGSREREKIHKRFP